MAQLAAAVGLTTGHRRTPSRAAVRFATATGTVVRHLPFGLSTVVAPTLVGFALLNGATFALDLGLLSLLHGTLHWLLRYAVSASYGTSLLVAYGLNRGLNFRSHGAVGPQLVRYVCVVAVNYAVCVLGITAALTDAGLEYRLARVAAGLVEAAVLYSALRWYVFRARSG